MRLGRSAGRQAHARGGPGFTLLETMVVLLMLGLAAAVVVPDLESLLRPGPAAAARELAGVYRDARAAASDRGRTVLTTFDPRTGAWRTFAGPTGAPGEALAAGDLLDERPDTRVAPGRPGPVVVRFAPDGRARAPAVEFRARGRSLTVSVDPWTGAIRVR